MKKINTLILVKLMAKRIKKIIAVLNNTRRDAIIDTIINAILKKDDQSNKPEKSSFKSDAASSHIGAHPFN